MPICGIYKIESPSGSIYIGQSIDIEKRLASYKRGNCKPQWRIFYSIKKHGWENHKVEVLKECLREELNYYEKYYVDLFNTFNTKHGMNLRDGGGSKTKMSEASKLKNSKAKKGILVGDKNGFYGKKHSEETKLNWSKKRKGVKLSKETIEKVRSSLRESWRSGKSVVTDERRNQCRVNAKKSWANPEYYIKMSKGRMGALNPTARKVFQLNTDGTIVKEWGSLMDICRHYGYKKSTIYNCCIGKTKTTKGYVWRFEEGLKNPIILEKKIADQRKPIMQYSLEGEFIKEWPSAKDAGESLNLGKGPIGQCATKKLKTAYGFRWKFKSDKSYIDLSPNKNNKRPVVQYSICGELIKEWDSATDAMISLNKNNTSCILRVCKGEDKTAYGFKWEYKVA